MSVILAPLPLGMPCGQADAGAFPSAMFMSVMTFAMLTEPLPPQSPTSVGVRDGVGVLVDVLVDVPVGVSVAVDVGVSVGVVVAVFVGVHVGDAV